MKCLILAAGYATRLYPLTENFPKPLLKVGDKTIMDWLVDDISDQCDGFVVISNHRFAGHFRDWAATKTLPIQVVDDGTSTNETRLGAVRDIQYAIEQAGVDDDVMVIAGDNVLDFSLRRFISYAREKGSSCIMRYYEPVKEKLSRSGVLEIGVDDLVLGMQEKPAEPRSHWCCPPFYYYVREDIARIGEGIQAGCGIDAPGSFVSWLCTRARVHAMEMPGRRYDIGSLDSYNKVCQEYKGIN